MEARLNAQARILDAAESIVRERGVMGLTLQATAQWAGLSKGGLLYHFASKAALVDGLLRRTADMIAADFAAAVAAQRPGPGRVARAVLTAGLSRPEGLQYGCSQRSAVALLAAFYSHPHLLGPIRSLFASIREQVENDGLPPGRGAAVLAATDGIFLAKLMGLYTLGDSERQSMADALMLLVEGCPG